MVQDPWVEADRLYGLQYYAGKGVKQEYETAVAAVITHTPQEAYALVLAGAGCFPRDVITRRMIRDVKQGTGSWGRQEPSDLLEGLVPAEAPADTDEDGMPDEWERVHGLDPSVDDSAVRTPSGYTAIEDYLNELARSLAVG
jgi:hypothetical protein